MICAKLEAKNGPYLQIFGPKNAFNELAAPFAFEKTGQRAKDFLGLSSCVVDPEQLPGVPIISRHPQAWIPTGDAACGSATCAS
jgi:hypothetical protein